MHSHLHRQNVQSASIIVTRLFQRRKLRFFLPHISAYNLKVRRMPDVVRMFTFRIAVHACAIAVPDELFRRALYGVEVRRVDAEFPAGGRFYLVVCHLW